MIITCSKRDDILRDQKLYNEDKARRQQEYDAKYSEFKHERNSKLEKLRSVVKSKLSTTLPIDIDVYSGYGELICVKVSDDKNVHDESKALSWSWQVSLTDDGEVKKDSSSWSGLRATTPNHIEQLKQILDVLTTLNDIDWKHVLDIELPDYDSYMGGMNDPRYEHPSRNYDSELFEAELEDIVGKNIGVKGGGYKYYNKDAKCVYQIVRDSGTQYTVVEMWIDSHGEVSGMDVEPYRIKKSTFKQIINNPIETIELEV